MKSQVGNSSRYYALLYTMADAANSPELRDRTMCHLIVCVHLEAMRRRACRDTDLMAALHVQPWA